MTKQQAYHNFMSSFGWAAYDENTVPEDAPMPRLTYSSAFSQFDYPVSTTISLWDRSTSWRSVENKADEIFDAIDAGGFGGKVVPFDGGYIWIKRGQPFAQRMSDEDDTIRRVYISLEVEYLTA